MEHSTYSDFSPAEWDKACTGPNVVIDELEPMVDEPTSYRRAAQSWLELLKAIDIWLATSSDTRLAWVSVAITLNLTSTRGMASAEIARQLGAWVGYDFRMAEAKAKSNCGRYEAKLEQSSD